MIREIMLANKSYSEFRPSKIASTLKASGGVLRGGTENLIMKEEIAENQLFDNHRADARVKGPLSRSPSLTANMGTGGINGPLIKENNETVVRRVVRRLTPLECERLQGLPDNYTEGGSDTARYKAIGNGMAQPCADFVMSKVVEAIKRGSG